MKKLNALITAALCLCAVCTLCAAPAYALGYNFSAPSGPEYGKPTSIEPVVTADGGAMKNEDVSRNAALIPPIFGSVGAYTPNTGAPLTPSLAPGYMPSEGTAVYPGSSVPTVGYTEATPDLYYSGGYLAVLKIPSLGVNVKVYQGTDTAALAKGAGHFESTSVWDGNCVIAGHNRGAHGIFGEIHTLKSGDVITLTTKLGTRTYAVSSVTKVFAYDTSGLTPSATNVITIYTCVADQPDYRWCVTAAAIGG